MGNSPLVRLELPGLPDEARLYAKLESTHPGGSLKDRPVARLLANALEDGRLEGRRLLDVVGPAAAVSYAVHAAALGLPLTLILPADTPRDLLDRVARHGAETLLAELSMGEGQEAGGSGAGLAQARRLLAESPELYHFGDLAAGEDSWQAHYDSTGHELLAQVFEASGTVPEAFVMGVGSGATLMGVARRLLRRRSDLAILAVEPAPGETLPGICPLEGRAEPLPFLVRRRPAGRADRGAHRRRARDLPDPRPPGSFRRSFLGRPRLRRGRPARRRRIPHGGHHPLRRRRTLRVAGLVAVISP